MFVVTAARGGRCTEFLLSLAVDLAGGCRVHAINCDTDGIDAPRTMTRRHTRPRRSRAPASFGVNSASMLASHDSYGFFSALSELVVTGPTRTNVNDYRAILIQIS